ncbi:MAG TPA: HDOD domain-containing protein [Noviherbaspirillum sp.]
MNAIINTGPVNADKTMEALWARVRQRGDLPGFSKVVSAIIGAMRGDDDREFNMTKTVLQDPALTQKVLRLANSAMYSVFGQGINTVSKAVIVLGTEAIGHLALGLKLIDGLSTASSDSASARAEMEKSVLAGHIARQVTSTASTRDAEEAVVCAMLHTLGHMMTTFYLPDRWQQVQARAAETGVDENQAARDILGMSLDDVGRQVAQQWGLPAGLIHTLQDAPPKPVGEPIDHDDWLAAVSTLSSRCAGALCSDDPAAQKEVASLASDYAEMLGLEQAQIINAVDTAKETAAEEGAVVVRTIKRSDAEKNPADSAIGKPVDAASILAHGVADMRGVMETASASQLMSMALETVYQGLGFSRAIVFMRKPDVSAYAAHMCFGDGVQELMPRLVFSDAYQPDVFHASLANDKMIFVENAQDPAFVNKLPRWWRETLPTVRSFMVLPLTTNRRPIGFIYGDWDISKPAARIDKSEISPLNELRMLVLQAIEGRRTPESPWARRLT